VQQSCFHITLAFKGRLNKRKSAGKSKSDGRGVSGGNKRAVHVGCAGFVYIFFSLQSEKNPLFFA
jgi:hypothetical protein